MGRRLWTTLLVLTTLLTATGCGFATVARLTVNDPLEPEDVGFIVPGTTTLREVVERLGTPDELTGLTDGAMIAYHFLDATFSRVNFGWPLRVVTPVQPDLIISGGGLAIDAFIVTFDRNWIARDTAFGDHAGASRFNPIPIRARPDPPGTSADCCSGQGPL